MHKKTELKIYEVLGVKVFKKVIYKIHDLCVLPFTILMSKKDRKEFLKNPDNYNMKKGHGLQDLKDFKKMILLNTSIHTFGLFVCIPNFINVISGTATISATIINLSCIIINCYCLMLQRYNNIELNRIIKKMEIRDKNRKIKLKEELINEDYLLNEYSYKIVNRRNKEETISFDKLLETLTYNQLKEFRNNLLYLKELSIYQDYCNSEDNLNIEIPIEKKKVLKFKPQNKN